MQRITSHIAAAAVLGLATLAAPAAPQAQTTDFYMGQMQQFGMGWCPRNWAPANGQLLSIQQNSALFSLLGVNFGGDGRVTFALPDLRERAPAGATPTMPVGDAVGATYATLTVGQLAAHTHGFNGDPTSGVSNSPTNSMMGDYPLGQAIYGPPEATPDTPMNPAMVGSAGAGEQVLTLSPILATNWCIALTGIYPSRP